MEAATENHIIVFLVHGAVQVWLGIVTVGLVAAGVWQALRRKRSLR